MEETKLTIEGSVALWVMLYSLIIGVPVSAFIPSPAKYIVLTLMVILNFILLFWIL